MVKKSQRQLEPLKLRTAITPDMPGRADLHMHTAVGDGLHPVGRMLEYIENFTDLSLIAITDHDEMRGAYQARELAARKNYHFEIMLGTEVTTKNGHLLALNIERPVPMFQSLESTIEMIHAQGGLAIVPHPMSWLIFSIGQRGLMRVHRRGRKDDIYFDAIETFNPSVAGRVIWAKARRLNQDVLHLPEVGGSDAHRNICVGTARTLFPGRSAADFAAALRAGTTQAEGEFWTLSDHLEDAAALQWKSMIADPLKKVRRAFRGAP